MTVYIIISSIVALGRRVIDVVSMRFLLKLEVRFRTEGSREGSGR